MLLRIQKQADGSFSALINNKTSTTFLHEADIANYIANTPEEDDQQLRPNQVKPNPTEHTAHPATHAEKPKARAAAHK